jgi:hypothetical protein
VRTRSLVTIDLTGGFGNQLFQVAYGFYLSEEFGIEIAFSTALLGLGTGKRDLSITKIKVNNVLMNELIHEGRVRGVFRKLMHRLASRFHAFSLAEKKLYGLINIDDQPFNKSSKTRRVIGYGQHRKYVQDENGNRRINLDISDMNCTNSDLLYAMRTLRPICVHIRGGDYKSLNSTFGLLSFEYFEKAINRARSSGQESSQVWVFTDDAEYVSAFFEGKNENYRILTSKETGDTLSTFSLMMNAKTLIIGNSTFSWWAAFANKNSPNVYYPDPWFKNFIQPEIPLMLWHPVVSEWKGDS